jgi:hypothetical protein
MLNETKIRSKNKISLIWKKTLTNCNLIFRELENKKFAT